jgi:hypothetical protein
MSTNHSSTQYITATDGTKYLFTNKKTRRNHLVDGHLKASPANKREIAKKTLSKIGRLALDIQTSRISRVKSVENKKFRRSNKNTNISERPVQTSLRQLIKNEQLHYKAVAIKLKRYQDMLRIAEENDFSTSSHIKKYMKEHDIIYPLDTAYYKRVN